MAHERIAPKVADRIERLQRQTAHLYGVPVESLWVILSPYRVCPLGAHVDHQHGLVTGMALDHSVLFAFAPREDGCVELRSGNFSGVVSFSLDAIPPPSRCRQWGDYMLGAAHALRSHAALRRGLCGLIEGDMPIGGLSSSAAVGVAYLTALGLVNDIRLTPEESIQLDAHIEHEYIGVNNGILDQTTILASRRNHLLLLDCQSASWSTIPAPGGREPFSITVVYSGVDTSLASTGYNQRVHECNEAAARLLALAGQPVPDQPRLRHVSNAVFDEFGDTLPDALHRRALHYFTEQRRVLEGVLAWEEGDWSRFGRLVQDSGRSSIHNYECGCPPLISLYTILNQCEGVYGARFSGAGFRGCCVGLAVPEAAREIEARVLREYAAKHPEFADRCRVIFCHTDDGARIVCEPSC